MRGVSHKCHVQDSVLCHTGDTLLCLGFLFPHLKGGMGAGPQAPIQIQASSTQADPSLTRSSGDSRIVNTL